ncbi:MAG: hypothetical protein IPK82_22305 [Polyangiaceae bacterium]|nr:hypothetical protein [Polyangiaceae bacterium]
MTLVVRTLSAGGGRSALLSFCAVFLAMGCAPNAPEVDNKTDESADQVEAQSESTDRAPQALERLAALRKHPISAAKPDQRLHVRIGAGSPSVHIRERVSNVGLTASVLGVHTAKAEEINGVTVHPGAGPSGSDLVMVPTEAGVEDWVVFTQTPATKAVSYSLALENVAGLRLVSGVLELLDASGTPRLRAPAPYLVDSKGTRHQAHFDLRDCNAETSGAPPWGRPVTAPGRDVCRLDVAWNGADVVYPAALDPAWELTTESLAKGRRWHTATSLSSDTSDPILMAGGFDGGAAVPLAELYQPKSRTFAATGALFNARGAHAAVQLQDGSVLVAGGAAAVSSSATGDDTSGEHNTLERYDPTTGAWSAVGGTLVPPRANFTATRLGNGKVVFIGGQDTLSQPIKVTAIFDPALPQLDNNGPLLALARAGHTATAIDANRVLVVGGFAAIDANSLKSTEIFDGGSNTVGNGPAMIFSRAYHTATVLTDGRVLLAGGISKPNDPAGAKIHETTEVYTPNAGIGLVAQGPSMSRERAYHAAARIETGDVVISGGFGGDPVAGTSHTPRVETELFDPVMNKMSAGPDMTTARLFHTLTSVNPAGSLVNGEALPAEGALAAGGVAAQGSNGSALASAELILRPLGEACAADIECASGQCSDGVCCNVGCENECDSCEATLKQSGADTGTCGPSKAGVAVGKQLTDGPDLGTQCAANVVSFYTCDGAGNKSIYFAESCNGNTCDQAGIKCIETCNDITTKCLSDAWCEIPVGMAEGKCAPKRDLGEVCDSGKQCKNPNDLSVDGFCIDGVCCNTVCDQVCEACNAAGFAGTCVHSGINGLSEPEGDRQCKKGPKDKSTCAGFCDAQVSQSVVDCQYPDQTVLCGAQKTCTCEDNGACVEGPATQSRFACNAEGACAESDVQDDGTTAYVKDCLGHLCGAPNDNGLQQCATTCATDADCLLDFFCDEGACAPLPDTGRCDGGYTLRMPGADDIDCRPYLCPTNELACRATCASDLECVEPEGGNGNEVSCNPDNLCEAPPAAPKLPSCTLSSSDTPKSNAALFALLAALGLTIARRRRR